MGWYRVYKRIVILFSIMFFLLVVLTGRFFYCQLIEGPNWARQANSMRSRGFGFSDSQRGQILDRFGIPLTGYSRVWCCFGLPDEITDVRKTSLTAATLLNLESWKVENQIRQAKLRAEPFVLLKERVTGSQLRDRLGLISGLLVTKVPRRSSEDGSAIHVLGTVGYSDSSKSKEVTGLSGIELRYNQELSDIQSEVQVHNIIDGTGNTISGLSPRGQPVSSDGRDVVTTIDRRVQILSEKAADAKMTTGAVVVLDIASRDILALVSRPTFKPNDAGNNSIFVNEAGNINRALSPFYPGSLFKIAVAAAGLETGRLSKDEEFYCSGSYNFDEGLSIGCWKETGHGIVNVARALAESCNAAFIQIALKVGRTNLLSFCNKAGFFSSDIIGYGNSQQGSGIEIDLGRAALANAALGQKGVMMTPLQAANLVATVADDGIYRRPRLVKGLARNGIMTEVKNSDQGYQAINADVAVELQQYLSMVTSLGTGRKANVPGLGCAGKTATSQTGRLEASGEEVLDTWFVGYFPSSEPRWVVAVLVEHGKSGAESAAPIFKEIAQGIAHLYGVYEIDQGM